MSTTPKFDTSDYLSDSSAVWKDKLKGQSTASASSSESTLSIPQSTQLSQDTEHSSVYAVVSGYN